MHDVNLAAVDLNLLNVVAAVLEERSATRAARRLFVTQSAVSNALRRARELFDDPLVLRRSWGLDPTPRAAAMLPVLRSWLEEAKRLIANTPPFDPATSTRTFTIASTDAVAIILLPPLLRALTTRAPRAAVRMVTLDRLLAEDGLARGTVDLLVGLPPVVPPGCSSSLVYRDPMACIVRRAHPLVRHRLTLNVFAQLPHVELALFDRVDDTLDRALASLGRARRVAVSVPHFSLLPLAVAETNGVATFSRRLAHTFARQTPVTVFTPPLKLASLDVRQVWHQRSDVDAGGLFLRSLVTEVGTPRTRHTSMS